MGQSVAIIIIIIFLALLFIPMALLTNNQYQVADVKQNLNLSAKSLINSIERDFVNTEGIAEGFARRRDQEIKINKEKLLKEFYDTLYKNYYKQDVFEEIQSRLILKILVLPDRFYIANLQDQWSPPHYFIHYETGKKLYFTTADEHAYYYDLGGGRIYQPISHYGITRETKNKVIIDKINAVVAAETAVYNGEGQLAIEIQNPDNKDIEYKQYYVNFNVLEGITFFVIYREDSRMDVNRQVFKYQNYNVVGYTLR